jgi:hypothetical protein
MGWQARLRENYDNDFDCFSCYCETYGIHTRLGYASPTEAWAKNPVIEGSINPSDFRVAEN